MPDQQLQTSSTIAQHLNTILRRREDTTGPVKFSSSLNADQIAALAMAIDIRGNISSQESYNRGKTSSVSPASKALPPDEMKARQREQWRISQANYRKRRREKELQVMREVKKTYDPVAESKETTVLLSEVESPSMTTEEWKKARRREQCRLSQARFRERKRLEKLQVSSEPSKKIDFKPKPVKDTNMTTDEWKKARRREQNRIYQVNYWKRLRLLAGNLVAEIDKSKQDIEQLQRHKAEVKQVKHPIELIQTFHRLLQTGMAQHQLPDVQKYQHTFGCTPALQVLSDLQREEFDSMESLKLHWLWYRSQFRDFRLSTISYEYLEAGEHAIVKATGNLLLGIDSEDNEPGGKSRIVVCPVLQQFEFENGNQVVQRITSEVDLVGGMVNTQGLFDPNRILQTLSRLSLEFDLTN
ncbi:hypothetical protein PHYBOEH_001345 [Phytophthora boehmeriae]|uniref:Bzip transcription factor n=1 Tax=Phytophthora boehmeriae TaxID=109152 RepID=A0A8T1V613_9STRA|nr:hypothetical protein PHYBOEH_001345 [Phytophthora boehmeriae]